MTAGRQAKGGCQHWCTPPKYTEAARTALGGVIELDPCSNRHSIVGASRSYALPVDGLCEPWDASTIYVNPPYGRAHEVRPGRKKPTTIADWLRLCADAAARGSEVVALIPVASNTRHWKDSVWPCAAAIAFLYDTRLRFLVDGSTDNKGAPMACCAVYWGTNTKRFAAAFEAHGFVVPLR